MLVGSLVFMNLEEIINSESVHLQKLHELVEQSILEEKYLSSRLIEIETDDSLTLGQKLADKVATFGGSWSFILIFAFILIVWLILNSIQIFTQYRFDPFPYILLNLVLSCIAAIQAPIIMMSQNRQEEKDRRRARSDFMVNLKAEMEVRNLHGKIDLLIAEQMKSLFEIQKKQIEMIQEIQSNLQSLIKK